MFVPRLVPVTTRILFTFLLCALVLTACGTALADDDGHKVVGGYFEEWSIYFANFNIANLEANGAAGRLTHLNYAFGGVNGTGCFIADSWADYQTPYLPTITGPYTGPLYGNFAALQQLKQLHPNLKVLISLLGADGFSVAAATDAGRQAFVSSCIDLFVNGNLAPGISAAGVFDGIDIDWEFPTAADKTNATLLMREFRRQLDALGRTNHRHYLLTMFGPAGEQNFSNIELAKVGRTLDFYNVQGYDFHGTWETSTNHASSLFDSPRDPARADNFYLDYTVNAFLKAGVPARKLVLGIPLYGRGWTGVPGTNHGLYQTSTGPAPFDPADFLQTPGVETYLTLSTATSSGYKSYFDRRRLSAWLYNEATQTFWSYDDPTTVQLKTIYINRGGLGGAFVWAVKDDDPNATLIKTMANGLRRHN
jgi:chitinase